ncbi:ABC transporter substrate-binding protein [Evansella cellulosilytica]|uniref:Extracellular solute-binding protein family 1 n=1 Tax=Evansella cellulosilytica (strain ATCC 21833 / DSM 2522 / FERM P-1141 / JCM 9156 / N-4) TaxID=649639 RepID=E6TQX6_EVAC2|nr:ABC transporter substrate-binding protein [Evansella cellulosilytica]ADU31751.1 extracellular solute-binding protein family 1 [Evansella cellulosilytica DSM 2522]
MNKYWKLGATTIIAASLLAACGGNNEGADADDDTEITHIGSDDAEIELVFWESGNTGYDVLIEEYVEMNPHISINLQNSSFEDSHDNLFTSLSANSGAPDIAMIEEGAIERFKVAENGFYNLYDLGASEVEGEFLDWVWMYGQSADGSFQFGLPTDIGPSVMYYRTDVFEEAGFDSSPEAVSELLETWDDFARVAQEIHDATGKFIADNGELIYNAKRAQATQQYFNSSDELIIDDHDEIRAAFNYTADLYQQGLVGEIDLWSAEWYGGMDDGSYAVMIAPAWMQGQIKDNSPEEGVWSITTMPEGSGNWGGSYLAIPAESEHPEEAYEFIKWLTAPEQQLKAYEGYGLFPSAPAVYDMPEFQEYSDPYFGGINTAQVFSEAAEAVLPVYKGRNYQNVNEEMVEALDNVAAGSDPDEEWEAMLERVHSLLERQ